MNKAIAKAGYYSAQIGGGCLITVAGFRLTDWLGIALAGVLLFLVGAAIERELD